MKTLYVTDLDGTLLNSSDFINPYSIEVINSLVEKGMLFTYATARSLVSASVVAAGLSARIPIIAYNGVFILNPATGEIIASEGFQREETEEVIRVLKGSDICHLVYSYIDKEEKVSWVTGRENSWLQKYKNRRQADRRFRPLPDDTHLYDGNVFYFTCAGEREELLPVYEIFSKDERYTCTLQQELYRPEYLCEIMPRKATKANAVLKLKEMWGCDRVVSFGDAVNDLPMFRISDECYAVENAVEELKAEATGVIGGNDADGVARWLKEHYR